MLLNSNASRQKSQMENHISIGIDQGATLWYATILNHNTDKKSRYSFKGEDKEAECYVKIKKMQESHQGTISVCYEAGRSGFTPARVFDKLGCMVRVLPYNKIQIINTGKQVKTDAVDSLFLAEIDPFDNSIPNVWVPSVRQEELRGIPREQQRIQKDIQMNNNRIIAVLQRWLVKNENKHLSAIDWEEKMLGWQNDKNFSKIIPILEFKKIKLIVEEIKLLEKHKEEWEQIIKETEEEERVQAKIKGEEFFVDVLREYRGIGDVIARTFCFEIADFNRFGNGKKFSSYLGLTPTPFASGKMNKEQGISKQGNPEIRRLAIQLAWLWMHWQPDSFLTLKYKEQLNKKGRQRKTAIVAMGRQLMVALYRRVVKGIDIEGAIKN